MTAPEPARRFTMYSADYLWWYHATGPIEVSVNGSTWHACTEGVDPKGDEGFSLYFAAPLSSRTGVALMQGANILVARRVGDPQSALVTTFLVE